MTRTFESIPATLRSGEPVTATVVRGPAPDWAERIEPMLRHKGEPWNWQNCVLLRRSVSAEARFYVLQRDGRPFANILVAETAGVGLLGHVWTEPADRRTGASALLIDIALRDFAARGGRVLFLGTEFDSVAWHFYRRRGFEPIAARSGYMARSFQDQAAFERDWFRASAAQVAPLDWCDWPAAAPLFLADAPPRIRIAATHLIGRTLPEGPLLPVLREQELRREAGMPPSAFVLRGATGGVVGYASSHPDPLWPPQRVVDVFCHPGAWDRAADLLAALAPSFGPRAVAYADAGFVPRRAALEQAGFSVAAILPRWVGGTGAGDAAAADVAVYVKE